MQRKEMLLINLDKETLEGQPRGFENITFSVMCDNLREFFATVNVYNERKNFYGLCQNENERVGELVRTNQTEIGVLSIRI